MALMSSDSNNDDALLLVIDNRSLTSLVIAVSVECSARGAVLVELSMCFQSCAYASRSSNFPIVFKLVMSQ